MERCLPAAFALLLLATATPVGADPGHRGPKITTFEFAQPVPKASIDEVLKVVAHDPNSWISEVQVRYEDADRNGGIVFAHTYCVQDQDFSDPGTPAKLQIPVFFDHPGNYVVKVRAISEIRCEGGNHTQTSRTLEMDVAVADPSRTFEDPDDASGAFDIASVEQTQEPAKTSATTEVVHRVTMFEAWTNDALAGPSYMEMSFDLGGDASSERVLTIDLAEDEGELRASMLNVHTGEARGYAAVGRPDEKTIELRMPPLLLKKGLTDYRWSVFIDGGTPEPCAPTNPCVDQAPDQGTYRHRL